MNKALVITYTNLGSLACGFAAWNVLRDQADYVHQEYQTSFPDLNNYDIVYLLGYTPTTDEQFKQILDYKNHLVIIDDKNHDTYDRLDKYLNDNADSWADTKTMNINLHGDSVISSVWEYCNEGFELPKLLKLIEDRHTWKFELQDTKALFYGMQAYGAGSKYHLWNGIKESNDLLNFVIQQGRAVLQYMNIQYHEFINDKEKFDYCDFINNGIKYNVLRFVYPYDVSELAELFLDNNPEIDFVLTIRGLTRSKSFKHILKSRNNGVNVNEIAKIFGGGGQPSSAGFILSVEDYDKVNNYFSNYR